MGRRAFLVSVVLLAASAAAAGEDERGGLRLTARAEAVDGGAAGRVRLVSTFENVGATTLKLFLLEPAGLGPHPGWRLVREDGRVFEPAPWIGQTATGDGIPGEAREIAPRARTEFAQVVESFVPASDGGADGRVPAPLEPGTYAVTCSYERDPGAGAEPVPNLWTGRLRSEPVRLVVTATTRLRIEVPPRSPAGGPFPLRATVTNPTAEPLSLDGAFVVRAHSKMHGGGSARFGGSLRVAPASSTTVPVDLADLTFTATDGVERGLYERIPDGHVFLDVAFVDPSGKRLLEAPGPLVSIVPRRPTESGSLRLSVEAEGVLRDGRIAVLVRLTNAGKAAIRVPTRLSYPRDFYLALRDEDGRRAPTQVITGTAATTPEELDAPSALGPEALIPEGSSWDGDAFERAPALRASDFERIEPGASWSRRIELSSVVHGKRIPDGRISVRAFWRNLDTGRRLGVPDPAFVGVLASEPVVLPAAPR